MSIELYELVQDLQRRVKALEERELEKLVRMGLDNVAMSSLPPRKRPGPPKGFKRKPREVINGS